MDAAESSTLQLVNAFFGNYMHEQYRVKRRIACSVDGLEYHFMMNLLKVTNELCNHHCQQNGNTTSSFLCETFSKSSIALRKALK